MDTPIFTNADLRRVFMALDNMGIDSSISFMPPREGFINEETTSSELSTIESEYPNYMQDELDIPEEETQQQSNETNAIPVNSESILISETTSRFSSAIWYNKIREQSIILGGAGGISSYVGFLLSRINPNSITVYDNDVVEETNLSGQFYETIDIGQNKVRALTDKFGRYSNYYRYTANADRFTLSSQSRKVMICGFDNMQARRDFFAVWFQALERAPEDEKADYLFIDGRLAAEEFQVFCIQGNDTYHINKYSEEWLFSDEEAEETQCSYKQTSFCANMIASIMVNLFVNFVANKCGPLIDRAIPFFTYYDASQMFLKEEF